MKARIALIVGLILSIPAAAYDFEPRRDALREGWYVAPMLAYQFVDEQRGTDDGLGYALSLGYRGSFAAVELKAAAVALDRPEGDSADLRSVGVNLLLAPLVMLPVARDVHFIIGYAWNQRSDHPGFSEDDQTYFIDTGLGYMPSFEVLGYDLALRLEYLYRLDTQQPVANEGEPREFSDTLLRVGLQLPLSKRPPPPQEPQPAAVEVTPADSDADGVADDQDRCPGSADSVSVDAQGCAL